jgi:hypothetical protein
LTFAVNTKLGAYAAIVDRIKTARFLAQASLNSTLKNEHAECLPKKDAAGVWHASGAGGRVAPSRRNARKREGTSGRDARISGQGGQRFTHTH